jgi:hypothetical protein
MGCTLEWWSVPQMGTLIVQHFGRDGSIVTFADWPTGDTFADFEAFLTGATAGAGV